MVLAQEQPFTLTIRSGFPGDLATGARGRVSGRQDRGLRSGASLRPKPAKPLVRFAGLPGELELGEPALLYLTEIVHRRPREWFADIDRLHQLLQSFGPEVLPPAIEEPG